MLIISRLFQRDDLKKTVVQRQSFLLQKKRTAYELPVKFWVYFTVTVKCCFLTFPALSTAFTESVYSPFAVGFIVADDVVLSALAVVHDEALDFL